MSRDAQLTLLPIFRWQKYRVKGAWENETLHVISQLLLLRVCQISSKLNIFQRKKASEEKSGRTKKNKFYEMLNLLNF